MLRYPRERTQYFPSSLGFFVKQHAVPMRCLSSRLRQWTSVSAGATGLARGDRIPQCQWCLCLLSLDILSSLLSQGPHQKERHHAAMP
jgi:hypothetical protein